MQQTSPMSVLPSAAPLLRAMSKRSLTFKMTIETLWEPPMHFPTGHQEGAKSLVISASITFLDMKIDCCV
jgi:hypothetical protein